jgi:hypothetical protein
MRTIRNRNKKNRTQKNRKHTISGSVIKENKEGWKIVEVHGKPFERGFAHGFLLYKELAKALEIFPFMTDQKNPDAYKKYIAVSKKVIQPIVKKHFPEIYEEIEGIAAGAIARGVPITTEFLIARNSHSSLQEYIHPTKSRPSKCSAFIATGDATETGEIVMGHTTHAKFTEAQLYNIILFMTPDKGHPFVMQTAPGLVASDTDWFLCSTGIIGCETTISQIHYKPRFGYPFFCRIRQAMQYGTTLDEYSKIMKDNNAGDYACSWLFGDINTNEIMLCEIGLHISNIQKTRNGIFYGMNSSIDHDLRTKETNDRTWNDKTKSTGARTTRLNQLLYDTYYGKLNTTNAREILADHYDTVQKKNQPNNRTICIHSENGDESNRKRRLHGCTDGKVTDSKMARNLAFWGRFGSACGRHFSVDNYIKQHPKFSKWKPFMTDFKTHPWVTIREEN